MKDLYIKQLIPSENQKDRDILSKSFLEIWNSEENLKFLSKTGLPFDYSTVNQWFTNFDKERMGAWSAQLQEDNFIGIAFTKREPIEGFELFSIGISPGYKKIGIGKKLLYKALEDATAHNFRSVKTSVFADNRGMLIMLLKSGFTITGIDYKQRFDGADLINLIKFL